MNILNSKILKIVANNITFNRFIFSNIKNIKSRYNINKNINRQKSISKEKGLEELRRYNKEILENKRKNKDENAIGPFGYSLLAIPIITFGLGTWQVSRLKWKLTLIEDMDKRRVAKPVDLPYDLDEINKLEYYPIKVRGKFLYEKEFTIGPKSLIIDGAGASESGGNLITAGRSNTGFNVITPFKLEDRDLIILVNRGWIPSKQKNEIRKKSSEDSETVEIIGVVRLTEKRPPFIMVNRPDKNIWMYRDVNAMAEIHGTDPVFIDLRNVRDTPGEPISGQTRIVMRNEHLSYIITWYSLSLITGFLWHRQFIRKLPFV